MRQKLFFLLVGFLVSNIPSWGFKVGNLYYNRNSDGETVTVTYETNHSGGTVISNLPNYSNLSGWLSIPSTVTYENKTYIVTAIDRYAFCNCKDITGLNIPNSVKDVGMYAFYHCTGLVGVSFGTALTRIGQNAFDGCSGCVGQLTFPSTLTTIDRAAFKDNTGITSVILPSGLKKIDDDVFTGCTNMTSVSIPNSVTSIGTAAFYGCTSLTGVDIPNSVTTIGSQAFLNCNAMTNMSLGNSVTSIGNKAFSLCKKLTSLNLPNSVKSIGEQAFYNCTGIKNYTLTLPSSITSIGDKAFYGCGLTAINCQITDPRVVTIGGNSVFDGTTFSSCMLNVKATSLGLFKKAYMWEQFSHIIPDVYTSSISINEDQLELLIGGTEKLTLTVLPANACPDANWTSSNTAVATVDENGTVTAKSAGVTTIKAKTMDGTNLSASCQVTVLPRIRGDINGDGVVTSADITLIYDILLNF